MTAKLAVYAKARFRDIPFLPQTRRVIGENRISIFGIEPKTVCPAKLSIHLVAFVGCSMNTFMSYALA